MQLLLEIQPEKLPFVIELMQQLDGVKIVRMENGKLPEIAEQLSSSPAATATPSNENLGDQMDDLQNELNDLFG